MDKNILAIVTAKGNSRRLPGKNLYSFAGKPLLWWTLQAAKKSKYIAKTIVSSDSDEILEFSKNEDVLCSKRPSSLSEDNTSSEDVLVAVLKEISDQNKGLPEFFILLQPTSPLRTDVDIDNAISLFFKEGADSLVSGYEINKSPYKTLLLDSNDTVVVPNFDRSLLHDIAPRFFYQNGAIYIVKTEKFLMERSLFTGKTIPFFMEQKKSIDIDTMDDLKKAESYLT